VALNNTAMAGSRSRPQARKKVNDDAAYFGPPTGAGVKRQAIDKAEGEPRVKRKKVDAAVGGVGRKAADKTTIAEGGSLNVSLIEFKGMPIATLYGYIAQFELIPSVIPSPLTADDPPPPPFLQDPMRYGSRAPSPLPTTTPANRPRRESKDHSRRRSSRLADDILGRTPLLSDIDEFNGVLADIAEKHFRETVLKEVDTLASFMCAVKAKVER